MPSIRPDVPPRAPPPPCNFRALPDAGPLIDARCRAEEAALAQAGPAARLEGLCDSRALHRRLFQGLAPAAWPDAAGTWRGTAGSSIADAPRAVFLARRMPGLRSRDLCLPAAEVAGAMADLAGGIRALWHDRPGADDPWRDGAYPALAGLTARFFAIHPYMDGNGHIWRLSLPLLAQRLGLLTRPDWTVDRRPYGPDFSLALQWHGDHPTILADQLRRWFPAPGPSPAPAPDPR